MSIAPSASATLGNLRYDTHLSRLEVQLGLLPAVNSARLSLPAGVRFTAVPGDDATIVTDGGDGSETVLTGTIAAVRRTFTEISVTVADAGAALAALRPAITYQGKSASDVITALAGDAGADCGRVDLDLDLAAYVADQGRTAAEHIGYLATLAGGIAYVDADNTLVATTTPGESADRALLFGREFLDYTQSETPTPTVARMAIGSGTAGSTSAPEALQPSLGPLPDGATPPGTGAVWTPSPVLRTPAAAQTGSTALSDRDAAAVKRLRARCFLLPALRPGQVIEIQELPDDLGGATWLLTRVGHRLDPRTGGETTLEAVWAGASSGSLLGALLGAIGSLL